MKKKGSQPQSKGIDSSNPVQRWLKDRVSAWLPSETLANLGVDSLDEVQMRNDFCKTFSTEAPLSLFVSPNQTLQQLMSKLTIHLDVS
jgi:hypothetical protein